MKQVINNDTGEIIEVEDDNEIALRETNTIINYEELYSLYETLEGVKNQIALMEEKAQAEEAPAEEEKFEPQNDVGLVAVAAGKGVADAFTELGVNEIITGGQTMNPSINDIVAAIKKANAKTVFVFPNNSNIVMAALQAKDVLHDEVDVIVISTKTIPEGIAAVSQFSPDLSNDENVKNMKETISHIVSGEITYAVKDTKMNGVEIKKNNYMAIMKKKIICCESKSDRALEKMLKKAITEDNYLATIFVGENVSDKILKELKEDLPETYPNIEFDIRRGDQPVYDYLVGIE